MAAQAQANPIISQSNCLAVCQFTKAIGSMAQYAPRCGLSLAATQPDYARLLCVFRPLVLVGFAEYFLQIIRGVGNSTTRIHILFTHFQPMRFLGKLFAIGFFLAFIGPVNRLVHVPKVGGVDFLSMNA